MIRLDDGRVGFGRRRSLAAGHSQTIGQSRKAAAHDLYTARIPGTTVSASDMESKKTKERLELRQNIRELIQAGRPLSAPASARVTSKKASPRERTPIDEEQAVLVVVVLQSMFSVEERAYAHKSG